MRLPKSRRTALTTALARPALRNGHISAGLAMLRDLDDDYGTHGRQFETMRAVIYELGDGTPTSGVLR